MTLSSKEENLRKDGVEEEATPGDETRYSSVGFVNNNEVPEIDLIYKNGSPDQTKTVYRLKEVKMHALKKLSPPRGYKMKIFVFLTFLAMITEVSVVWYYYKKQSTDIHIGTFTRISEDMKILHIDYDTSLDRLIGKLGLNIPNYVIPYSCKNNETSKCWEWRKFARLRISVTEAGWSPLKCCRVSWESLNFEEELKDCYKLPPAFWYGGALAENHTWPIHNWNREREPFLIGKMRQGGYGGVLEPYWFSSRGVTIQVDNDVPLFVSMISKDAELCLMSSYTFPYNSAVVKVNDSSSPLVPWLNYTICAASSIVETHDLKQAETNETKCQQPIENVIWSTAGDQSHIEEFARNAKRYKMDGGFFLVKERWERNIGDYDFDPDKFPNPHQMNAVINNCNLSPGLFVHPYINVVSNNFNVGLSQNYFVQDKGGDVPELVHWEEHVHALIDMTSSSARDWWVEKLLALRRRYGFKWFSLYGDDKPVLPYTYHFQNTEVLPQRFIELYLSSLMKSDLIANHTIMFDVGLTSATQWLPNTVLRLPHINCSWASLADVIPWSLTAGLLGYPTVSSPTLDGDTRNIDEMFYFRYFQLASLFPVVELSLPPWHFGTTMVTMCGKVLDFRSEVVYPALKLEANQTLAWRPLWCEFPKDNVALTSSTEFMIGHDLLFAPILDSSDSRNIYLPAAAWKDELTGHSYKGPIWLFNYTAPRVSIPYFTRLK